MNALIRLADKHDQIADNARTCLELARVLNAEPTVEQPDDDFFVVTWWSTDLGAQRVVKVISHWTLTDPTMVTVIEVDGDWQDEYESVGCMVEALAAAEAVLSRIRRLT